MAQLWIMDLVKVYIVGLQAAQALFAGKGHEFDLKGADLKGADLKGADLKRGRLKKGPT